MKTSLLSLPLLAFAFQSHANLIQNGGFEDTLIAPNTIQGGPTIAAWGTVPALFNGSTVFPFPNPASGSQFVDISNLVGPGISQSFSVLSANSFSLSWIENTGYYGANSPGTSPYLVTLTGNAGPVFSTLFDAYNYGVWQSESLQFPLAPGNYTLTFSPNGVYGGFDTLLDDITLNTVPDQSHTAVTLGFGALALSLLRRKQPAVA